MFSFDSSVSSIYSLNYASNSGSLTSYHRQNQNRTAADSFPRTPIRIPVRAPKANAFAESFIATTKREVLNHFVCFSRGQLDYIVSTWVKHYNTVRPHNGVGRDNTVLDVDFAPKSKGVVRRKTELGGILSSYYRDAA